LNRPDVRNAFNAEMIAELSSWAVGLSRQRGDVRAVVIGGAGKVFCAGADASWLAQSAKYSDDENIRDATATSRMFRAIDELPMPVIGRVHGAAIGGGAGLAAVCDIVVAADDAVFGFTEVKLGIIPAVISPFVLTKIGPSAARELFITGARFPAARAYKIDLAHAVVAPADLDQTIDRYLAEILASGPEAIAAAKMLIRDVSASPDDVTEVTARALASRRASTEGQEGLRAFLEKRKPRWSA
ncbi:MAG TPA: enoyl-CoA hydratase-related protein, partial [Vicinamibacterales bacterium]|nr:enoyl-CoA hydratase-related protein [Vicinamibacterales bacterium]